MLAWTVRRPRLIGVTAEGFPRARMVAGRTCLLRVGAVTGIAATGANDLAVDLLHPLAAAHAEVRLLVSLGIVHGEDYLCIYLS